MHKPRRAGQSREGVKARRKLEFDAITDQVKRRRVAFMARLTARLEPVGTCLCYRGTRDHKGYARFNLRYKGEHLGIGAHRAFLILKIGKPIPLGFEAGHDKDCPRRTCVRHVRLEHYTENAASNGAQG